MEEILKKIKNQKLDIFVVSFGGCGSNFLTKNISKLGYKCISPIWESHLCHYPYPINCDVPIIYLYRNPPKALASMKRRGDGIWGVNHRKLSLKDNIEFSNENLLNLMFNQFDNWISSNYKNIIYLNFEELFSQSILTKVNAVLPNNKIKSCFIKNPDNPYYDSFLNENSKLFEKYKKKIDFISNHYV